MKLLKDAEGASAVDAAVELYRKAILTALADKMKAGVSLNDIAMDDIITTCQTALSSTEHDSKDTKFNLNLNYMYRHLNLLLPVVGTR
eukprot:SAG31_NODE_927_length_10930_cov_15.134983_5_plen_88_part_00